VNPDAWSRRIGWTRWGSTTTSWVSGSTSSCEKVTPSASARRERTDVEGMASARSIFEIIDRLTPEAAASCSMDMPRDLRCARNDSARGARCSSRDRLAAAAGGGAGVLALFLLVIGVPYSG